MKLPNGPRMPVLHIIADGDGALEGKWNPATDTIHHVTEFTVTSLAEGMASGAPSVVLLIDLPNGEKVFAESSLKLFLTAAEIFAARHGDPRWS